MATTVRPSGVIGTPLGASVRRREDPRFLTGRGTYTDDIKIPGATYAAFVRSPFAHARVRAVDATAARSLPGVVTVFTGQDMLNGGVQPMPVGWLLPNMKIAVRRVLAPDVVRYVGEAVAMVIADSPYA